MRCHVFGCPGGAVLLGDGDVSVDEIPDGVGTECGPASGWEEGLVGGSVAFCHPGS